MRLLVACPRKLLLLESDDASVQVVEDHRPEYYGVTWTEDGGQLCLSHSGVDHETLVSMETYMDSDIGYLSVGGWESLIATSAPHQALCVGDQIVIVNTGRNCLTLVDRRTLLFRHVWIDGHRWDRKGLANRCGSHFNSVFVKGDRLYVLAHNWDRGSFVQVLSWPELRPLERIEAGCLSAHNVWVTDDGEMIVCDSARGSLVEIRSGHILWQDDARNTMTRGLASDGRHVFVGQVRHGSRAERTRCDAGVWVIEREGWKTVDFLPLPRSGNVCEVRLVDVPDLCHHGRPYTGTLAGDPAASERHRDFARQTLTGWPERLDIRLSDIAGPRAAAWQAVLGQFEVFGSRAASLELALSVARGVAVRDVAVTTDVYLGVGGDQHAGVVARHCGPGDTNLVTGALTSREGLVFAEILEQDGERWHCLASREVPQASGRLTLRAEGRRLELLLDGEVAVRAEQRCEPAPGAVGLRGRRGLLGRCVVRDADAAAAPLWRAA